MEEEAEQLLKLQIKLEKQKNEKLLEEQRAEQQEKRLSEERRQEIENTRKQQSDDIDQYLGGTELLNQNNNKEETENLFDQDSKKDVCALLEKPLDIDNLLEVMQNALGG